LFLNCLFGLKCKNKDGIQGDKKIGDKITQLFEKEAQRVAKLKIVKVSAI
jgi:hypothetical protein